MTPGTDQYMSEDAVSVEAMEVDEPIFPVRPVPGWAQPIMSYMMDGSFPSDEVEARRVQRRSKAYTIINMELYKRSATTVLHRCIEPEEGQEMLLEIHQGRVKNCNERKNGKRILGLMTDEEGSAFFGEGCCENVRINQTLWTKCSMRIRCSTEMYSSVFLSIFNT